MRVWLLKFIGLSLWSAFLFAPFIARADEGFDIIVPLHVLLEEQSENTSEPFIDELILGAAGGEDFHEMADNEWSLRLKAGKDSVLSNDFSHQIMHDRTPLDHGYRKSLHFGVGLSYSFSSY